MFSDIQLNSPKYPILIRNPRDEIHFFPGTIFCGLLKSWFRLSNIMLLIDNYFFSCHIIFAMPVLFILKLFLIEPGVGFRRTRESTDFVGNILQRNPCCHRCNWQHRPCSDQHNQGWALPAASAWGPRGRSRPRVREQAGSQGRHVASWDHRRPVPPQHKEPRLAHTGLMRDHRRGPLRWSRLDSSKSRRQGHNKLTHSACISMDLLELAGCVCYCCCYHFSVYLCLTCLKKTMSVFPTNLKYKRSNLCAINYKLLHFFPLIFSGDIHTSFSHAQFSKFRVLIFLHTPQKLYIKWTAFLLVRRHVTSRWYCGVLTCSVLATLDLQDAGIAKCWPSKQAMLSLALLTDAGSDVTFAARIIFVCSRNECSCRRLPL